MEKPKIIYLKALFKKHKPENKLEKIIKDFVPARSKVDTGIIVKSNILGRSKAKQVEVSFTDEIYSGSLVTNTVSASQGGVYDDSGSFNYRLSKPKVVDSFDINHWKKIYINNRYRYKQS